MVSRVESFPRDSALSCDVAYFDTILVAMLTLTSRMDINVPTRRALVLERKDSIALLVTNLNNKGNVCKQ